MSRTRLRRRSWRPGTALWTTALAASLATGALAQSNGGGNGSGSVGGAGPGVGSDRPLLPGGPPGPLGRGGPGGGGIMGQDAGTGTLRPAGPNGSTTSNSSAAHPAPDSSAPLDSAPAPDRSPAARGAGR